MNNAEHWVFLNDHFCLASQASISIEDRGFLFGEGVFTTIRVNQGYCELLSFHEQRLIQQTAELGITFAAINQGVIKELIKRNQANQGIWRLKIIVTSQTVLFTLQPHHLIHLPVTLTIFPQAIERPLAHLKSLAYLDLIYVKKFAQLHGYYDALIKNEKNILLETGHSNIFWVFDNVCYVPDMQLSYLKGIFMQFLLAYADFPVQFVEWRLIDVPEKASMYICNALNHVKPVIEIEGQKQERCLKWEERFIQLTNQTLQLMSNHLK